MSYLITGCKGQLGSELCRLLPDALATDVDELDITDGETVCRYVQEHGVELIINCAAFSKVELAEDNPEAAFAVNAEAVAYLAACGAPVVHISTGYVFDGTSSRPYTPQDTPCPTSVYGCSKLAGECALMELAETAIVIRTSWLYASHGNNLLLQLLKLGSEKGAVELPADRVGSPTSITDLAQAIVDILPQIRPGMKGVYHYTNEGVCSLYDFAVEVMHLAGLGCKVYPTVSELPSAEVLRPFYGVLDKSSIRKDFNLSIPHWRESLAACIKQMH